MEEQLKQQLKDVLQAANFKAPSDLSMDDQVEFIRNKKAEIETDFLAKYEAKPDRMGRMVIFKNGIPELSVINREALGVKEVFSKAYSGNLRNTINTKEDVHLHLKSQGFNPNSKEYGDELLKMYKENSHIRS